MDRRGSAGENGLSPTQSAPPLRRRLSMEEDMHYQHIMTLSQQRRPSHPPAYQDADSAAMSGEGDRNGYGGGEKVEDKDPSPAKSSWLDRIKSRGKELRMAKLSDALDEEGDSSPEYTAGGPEELPSYSSSIAIEGVFHKKHEIENTTKRAEDRQWHTSFVVLNGTALSIYNTKKDWGWGKARDGPSICPDNPPWIRKAKLEKTYSLLHADAGIAADYKKRRYVIRVRAETDQFLLSCIELSTFIKWLECLFAAIDVAAPIDDRDFPRDMSIPRIQRIRWFRSQTGVVYPSTQQEIHQDPPPEAEAEAEGSGPADDATERRSSSPQPLPTPTPAPSRPRPPEEAQGSEILVPHLRFDPRNDPFHPLSTSSYPNPPNPSIDPHTGKWFPEHQWSTAHDLLYAKLCYSNLLFRSPRKSNYIISKGKQWFVDWGTGRMVRVLPPAYGEIEYFGPWQVIHTENRRI
ncbi:ph domain-containing [Trichoderma arundinaceum]|uniref:Ph domain-containing n=1 Tax=Trichoderma arundinaceum TaxID=490622 RepID=A0A395NGD6_TRIAR|nr:ph domain-containing [Trichoderma arundinaceum]